MREKTAAREAKAASELTRRTILFFGVSASESGVIPDMQSFKPRNPPQLTTTLWALTGTAR